MSFYQTNITEQHQCLVSSLFHLLYLNHAPNRLDSPLPLYSLLRASTMTLLVLAISLPVRALDAPQGNDSAHFGQSMAHFEQLMDSAGEVQRQGFKQQALPLLEQAVALSGALALEEQLKALAALAQLYHDTGRYPAAITLLEQVLTHDDPSQAVSKLAALNQLATIYSTLGNEQKARAHLIQAYQLGATLDPAIKTTLSANRLRLEMDFNHPSSLAPLLDTSWTDSQTMDKAASTAEVRISLAALYGRASQEFTVAPVWRDRARRLLTEATAQAEALSDQRLLSYALGYHGQILLESGQVAPALPLLKTATFLANAERAFESVYLWEWQIARAYRQDPQVGVAIDQYQRAIESLEWVRRDLIDGSPFTFHQKIQPLFTELADLLLSTARALPEQDRQPTLHQVQQVLEQAKSAEIQDYFQNSCVLPEQTFDLAQMADATALIYPVILADRVEMLVSIDNEIYQYQAEIKQDELEDLVNDFRYFLQDDLSDDDHLLLGEALYILLLAQVEPNLQSHHINTLLFVPDGILRTVPMSALFDGNQFIVEKYAIATTPGISLTLPQPLEVERAQIFAGGVSESVQGFAALPGVPGELANLKTLYGASTLSNASFSSQSVSQQLASTDFSIVHIATHGHFDSNPQQSFLLAYDDKLTMNALSRSIGTRRLLGQPLELLVLSACETAAGDPRAALGLAGVALRAGASSALATLWQISDAATVEVIDTFYDQVSKPGISKVQALQTAQIKLIKQPRFNHPNYWAPFLLIGNWL
jgi:CHAT domain-containing protein